MTDSTVHEDVSGNVLLVAAAWLVVSGPLLWGVVQTLYKAALLFR